ncbi:hypothetical protein M406DRAFT_338661 [Cryphonectria parasitica EP155]|uniref:Uncharacterized protein n=1 Tax=Cryphonectria parasitica (strain ATCC 38755 / EP155) TaxID=660469 RepID=A0A9P5CS66_CRYP1|nr:uncharacterized protein M406DRAFT_338661 [Cryphonectria parasitica EP155]KAF3768006.1 hypothetical protein M406DRAFT_338661 [Cryphonectria parasitica EP155]
MSSNNAHNNGSESATSPTRRQGGSPSPSPNRSASTSLQAAAAVNAGLQHQGSRRSSGSLSRQVTTSSSNGRRRSQVLMNLQLNDPAVPGPGEMVQETAHRSNVASPIAPSSLSPLITGSELPHHRAPSLGELHQELEAEQEAQVNRLLLQIRQQQAQILQYQNQSAIAGEESPGQSTPALTAQPIPVASSHAHSAVPTAPSTGSLPRSPVLPRSSFDLARGDLRHRSRTPSRGASPRLRSTSISQESGEPFVLGGRDESAFYQAETQMLTRENQMLRHRIRDLERQLENLSGGAAAVTREPAHHSGLMRSESVSEETRPSGAASASEGSFSVRETPKDE